MVPPLELLRLPLSTEPKSSLQLQCIKKHVFFGWHYQKSSNLRTFVEKLQTFDLHALGGRFCRKFEWGAVYTFLWLGFFGTSSRYNIKTKFTKQEQSSASSAFGCTWKLSAPIPKSTNKIPHESQNTKNINQHQPKPTTTAITFCQGWWYSEPSPPAPAVNLIFFCWSPN